MRNTDLSITPVSTDFKCWRREGRENIDLLTNKEGHKNQW
jgi:hypothetical protein